MEEAAELAQRYLDAILEVNEHLNLTRITSPEDARRLHLEDSLTALPEMEEAPSGPYADLGSGGGFPGVPLALCTGRPCTLVDSVKKKMAAVQSILEGLSIDGKIRTYDRRIEELSIEEPECYAVVTARALAPLPSLVELASPLLIKGGHLICFKGRLSDEERNTARKACKKTGMRFLKERSFQLEGNQEERVLVVFEKAGEPTIKLPRRLGMAQKAPLAD